jgi:superfamily II DNA or RNA helicase
LHIKITEIDAILSRVDMKSLQVIAPILSYQDVIWKKGQYAKKKIQILKKCYKSSKGKEALFLTGFIPRIQMYLDSIGYTHEIIQLNDVEIGLHNRYRLKNRTTKKSEILRPDQIDLIDAAFKNKRGMIKAPTGSGKSFLIYGIISNFVKEENVLILCHNAGIVKQLANELGEYFSRIIMFGGDIDPTIKFRPLKDRIVISTIQSFSRLLPQNYCDYFSCVIIDEAHRVSSFSGLYAEVLQNLLAPYRFGFTATLPTSLEAQFSYEGLIGPMIAELSINQAAELNILAKPKLKIIKAGYPSHVRDLRDYHSVYEEGIVQNETRNKQGVAIIKDIIDRNETVLIFVNKIVHGENIERLCFNEGISVKFIQGSSTIDVRERVKHELNSGITKAVLSTTVWKEGINIPNLNNVINMAGGKSEIATLQAIGRGLRKTTDKEFVTIYDFFDPSHPYLIAHFGERLCIYMDMEWL